MKIIETRTNHTVAPVGIDTPRPLFSWIVEGDQENCRQTAAHIQVSTSREQMLRNIPDMWDSGVLESSRMHDASYSGKALEDCTLYYWRVRVQGNGGAWSDWSEPTEFETAFLNTEHFRASWIGPAASPVHGLRKGFSTEQVEMNMPQVRNHSLPVLATSFAIEPKRIARARAYIAAPGMFHLLINDQETTANWFEPGESDFRKEIYYSVHDMTHLLRPGENRVSLTLGKGYYLEQPDGRYKKLLTYYGDLMAKCQLEIFYEDGTRQTVISDEHWMYTEDGPCTLSSWMGGEDYDTRKTAEAWNWQNIQVMQAPDAVLRARAHPPIQTVERILALELRKIDDGLWLLDFGQNFAGVVEFTLEAPRGTELELWYAELMEGGRITQKSTGSPIFDRYIFQGEGTESWHPRFCYHGFRYVELRVSNGEIHGLTRESFIGLRLRCANEKTGSFSCGNKTVNGIHQIILRSMEANMMNTCTDCPHREKLGWQEVPHLMWDSFTANFDVRNWMRKIVADTMAAQTEEGLVPDICPEFVRFKEGFRDDPSWGASCILLPLYLYQTYEDEETIRTAYKTMRKYMHYLEGKSRNGLLTHGLGDWGQPKEVNTPLPFVVSCTWLQLAKAMVQIASLLEKEEDAQRWEQLAGSIRQALRREYYHAKESTYATGTQASNALALYAGLPEETERAGIIQSLIRSVQESGCHLAVGEIALKPLLYTLSEAGEMDLVLDILLNREQPGYGYFIDQGATSLPEYWDMAYSQLHCMLGHAEGWFSHYLAGIRPLKPGYQRFTVEPYLSPRVLPLDCVVPTVYGNIELYCDENTVKLQVPFGTEAQVKLPRVKTLCTAGKYCWEQ